MNLNLKITPQVEAVLEDQSLDEQDQSLDEQDQSLDEQDQSLDEQDQSLDEQDQSLDEQDQSLDEQDQSLDEQDQSLDEYVTAILLDTALDILAKSKSAEYVHPWWNAAPAKNRTHR